jgi:hypothetical protein
MGCSDAHIQLPQGIGADAIASVTGTELTSSLWMIQ